jgi:hypothetical protein
MPAHDRLDIFARLNRKSLEIAELRVVTGSVAKQEWQVGQAALVVIVIVTSLVVDGKRAT